MTIKQFIEKAIGGGWDGTELTSVIEHSHPLAVQLILLDPKAWEAVGKVEGWLCPPEQHLVEFCGEAWRHNMHNMIDALCEGKTIEEFLKTL